jgi:ethanolamine utilization protein EutN
VPGVRVRFRTLFLIPDPRPPTLIMILARIVGTVVATRKDERLHGRKLLVARLVGVDGTDEKGHVIAVDTVGAGVHEVVLIVQGSSARMAFGCKECPIDAAVVGIVDTVEVSQ